MKKTVTLVELLISIVLMSVIVLGAVSFDLFSKNLYRSFDKKVRIMNDLAYIIEHMDKRIKTASGDSSSSGIRRILLGGNPGISIRRDVAGTPMDYGDDLWSIYIYNSPNLDFCDAQPVFNNCGAVDETLSSQVVAFNFCVSGDGCIGEAANSVIMSNLTLRFDPAQASDFTTNPEVSIDTPLRLSSFQHALN